MNKAYLQQLYQLQRLIESNQRELNHLRYISTSIAGCDFKEHFSGGDRISKVEETVIEIVDLENQIRKEIDEYTKLEKEIREVINNQEDERERLLLRLRYIECLTWEKIADKMNYSVMQVYRIHKKALRNLKKTW